MEGLLSYFRSIVSLDTDIDEEKIEEYKMLSGFQAKDIVRLRKVFLELTNGSESMSKEVFCGIEGIALNPLLDRICDCFGLTDELSSITFQSFLTGIAAFNAPGRGEVKLKTAFRIQDFDGDGMISKKDLSEYMKRITTNSLSEAELDEIVNEVFRETSSDAKQEFISYGDFQRVVILLDFQAKLHLPI
jgi:Ca2+-binding EF-hand superfamily protein